MPDGSSVEGPVFAERVRKAEATTQTLKSSQWDFAASPNIFGRAAACDVVAKEITILHDGHTQTRIGRLVMKGVGQIFNLMGPESPQSIFKSSSSVLLDEVNRQIGSKGLADFKEFRALGEPQQIEFY